MAQKPITKPTPAQLRKQAEARLRVLDAEARVRFRKLMATLTERAQLAAAERPAPYPKKDGAA